MAVILTITIVNPISKYSSMDLLAPAARAASYPAQASLSRHTASKSAATADQSRGRKRL
jgi:hypothetical protein